MSDISTFPDRIYEASIIADNWPLVLRELADAAGAKDALLIVINGGDIRSVGSTSAFQELCARHYQYASGHERSRRLLALQRAGFVTDWDVYTDAEILAEPVFTELLIPNGYGAGIATAIDVPSGDSIIFHAERPHADGPYGSGRVGQLDALRPHLARAALLSARLRVERARAAAAALEAVGLPAAILTDLGRPIAVNGLLAAMIPTVIQDRRARMTLVNPKADTLMLEALEGLRLSPGHNTVCSIPIMAGEQHPAVIVHLVPVRGAARDVFARSSVIMIATPVVPKEVPGATVLQALFDLTPAEARVAREVGSGRTVAQIAKALGLSLTTIRNQIAAVLAKSGLHRQVDLVSLLSGSGIPRKVR